MKFKSKHFRHLGFESKAAARLALRAAEKAAQAGLTKAEILVRLAELRRAPGRFAEDPLFGETARGLLKFAEADSESGEVENLDSEAQAAVSASPVERGAREPRKKRAPRAAVGGPLRAAPVPYAVWGMDGLDAETLEQMDTACRLPVAVRGAQMPDGHVGYGLPIGGVLATENAVIPYGVGVDIACRMKLSVVDLPASRLDGMRDRLRKALVEQTRFGIGARFDAGERREHDVMDAPAWKDLPRHLANLRDKAWGQLGSSGSGNHFVEFGEFELERDDAQLGLAAGRYLALFSHSGSRGFGQQVANFYTRLAMDLSALPKEARRLAWLDLDSEAGQEYWLAMNLAGDYASANHDLIHRHVLRAASLRAALQVENHHNFAWIERHDGRRLVVHRKGATPAARGTLGIIPGNMADPGFLVRGKGEPRSLESAAHGAGRRMSRRAAKQTLTRSDLRKYLEERGVTLLSAGIDEAPMAYKSIFEVMAAQSDLVEILGRFYPRLVRMSDDGTAED